MIKVAFICVHNSCRSQIAEALGRKLAADVFESYSAGMETKPHINPDAVRLMKQVHSIDMEQTQYSKLLDELQIGQSTLSHHMKILCDSGVVRGRKEGKWVHYSIDPAGAEQARQLLAQQLTLLPFPEKDRDCCCEE